MGSNADAVAKFLWVNAGKPSGGDAKIAVRGYVFNRPVATRFEVFRILIDTSSETTKEVVEPVGFNLSPSDGLYFVADTDTNNATVNIRFSLVEYQRS